MSLRNILRGWRGGGDTATPTTADAAVDAATVAELVQLGVLQRQRAQYVDAEHSLMRAIELEHDCGEAHHNLGLVHFEQGQFEDAIDHLELAAHFSPRLVSAHLDLGAALAKLGRHDAAVAACRMALEFEPGLAAGWLRLGNLEKARGDLQRAVECYRAAIDRDAALADAHCQLAFVLYKLGRYDESRAAHAIAIAARPDFAETHHNLGLLLLETGDAEQALVCFEHALALRPDIIETRTCIAHALRDLGQFDEALANYDAVLAQQPNFGDALINRCYTLLMREDYSAGWAQYEQRFSATSTPLRGFPYSEWRGEPLAGKRILVYAEQGLGDELMFASCVPDLLERGGNVVIECNDRLARLYARSFKGALVHGGAKTDDKAWLAQLPPVDFQVAIGSLPLHIRRSRAEFPARHGYLSADAGRVEKWRQRLAAPRARLRVGIAWRGGSLRTRQMLRSIPIAQWLPLLQQPELEFVSLQYGDAASELAQFCESAQVEVRDFSGELADLDEAAALIGALDLVISVDNTVVHLAGALGQKVWALITCAPEWRYPRQGADMPWYPGARLFRQPLPREWGPVIGEVGQALRELVGVNRV